MVDVALVHAQPLPAQGCDPAGIPRRVPHDFDLRLPYAGKSAKRLLDLMLEGADRPDRRER